MQVRRGRLVLGGIAAVLALLVAGVWLLPSMLDWNRYRDGIAALASQQLGRPVHIGGAVSLQLLPQPILTANDVAVEAGMADEHGQAIGQGTDAIGLRAKALRLRVALGPLLAGKVDARELTLQGADLRLPWPPPPGAFTQRPPSWLTGLQARIEDGRLQVGDLVLSGIEGTVTTDPDTGTLAAAGVWESGSGTANMRRWRFTARLGRPGRDGTAALDMTLDGQDALRDTGGSFSGQIAADGALAGRVAGRGPDLSMLMPAPALPWRSNGRLNAAGGLAIADELALEIGGAPARGAVALRIQPRTQLDLAITAGRLDLDAWLPALLGGDPNQSPWPDIPTGIDLSAEAATLAGGTVRQLRGGVDLDGGVVHLRDVTGVLPGDAPIELKGEVTVQRKGGTKPDPAVRTHFDGTVALKAPDLRATLRWLQHGVQRATGSSGTTAATTLLAAAAALPGGVLHGADLSGQVSADSAQATVTGLKGRVDESTVAGNVSLQLGARPGVSATLTADSLVLDGWLPDPDGVRGWLLRPGAVSAALAQLRTFDSDVSLSIGKAAYRDIPAGPVALEMLSDAAHITLKRLEAQPLGSVLSMSGQVGEGGRVSDGRLDLSVADLVTLQAAAAQSTLLGPAERLLEGRGRLQLLAAGPPDALSGRATLELGDLRLEAQPVVNLVTRRWAGPLTLHHPGAPRLLETLGIGGAAAWLGDGSLSLLGQATITPGRFEMQGATLSAGSLRGSGQVVFEGRRLFGSLGFDVLPLPLVYPRSSDPLPLGWIRDWQAALHVEATEVDAGQVPVLTAASADVTLKDGVLTLARGMGKVDGGTLTGEASVDAAADPPHVSVRVQVTGLALSGGVFDTPVDVVAGRGDASATVSAAGFSPAALLATLSGSGSFRLHDGLLTGFDLAAAGHALALPDAQQATAQARTALLTGNSSFDTLTVPLAIGKGIVSATAELASAAGHGTMTGSLDLQNAGVDMRISLQPVVAGDMTGADGASASPTLGLRITGSAGSLVRVPELTGVTRWLTIRTQ